MHLAQLSYAVQDGQGSFLISYGVPPAEGGTGYFSTIVRWIPSYTPHQIEHIKGENFFSPMIRLIERIHSTVTNVLKALKGVLGDMNATSDLLRLVINGTKFAENTFDLPNLKILVRAFVNITDFNSARSWLSRSYDILSGEAATQERIWGGWDYLRVASKAIYLVNDICTTMKWLCTIGLLSEIVSKEIGTIHAYGRTIVLTVGRIGTISTLLGTVPNFLDNLRLVVKYSWARPDVLGRERVYKLFCSSLDSVSDVCRVASTILFNLPNPLMPFFGLVVSTIGTTISLSKFYYTEKTRAAREKEKIDHAAKKEASACLCEKYLQLAALQLEQNNVEESALQALKDVLKYMDEHERPLMQQLAADELAQQQLLSAERQAVDNAKIQLKKAFEIQKALL